MGSILNNGVAATGGSSPSVSGGAARLLLYSDLIDHLVYNVAGGANDPEQRDYRVACQNAYRELAFNYDWQYYYTNYRISTVEPYSTGTISSSGAVVNGSGATFPTWAKLGRLQVGTVVYPISVRNSSSQLTLGETPVEDIAASSTYTLYQSQYTLPADFRRMARIVNENNLYLGDYISPAEWLNNERSGNTSGPARCWTILADYDLPGRFALVLTPYPSAATTIDFIYQRGPRRMRLTGQETNSRAGTIAGSAAGTTITGTSTAFDASMVGSYIRWGTSTSSHPDGDGGLNPYTEQLQITGYTSSTSITVSPAITTAMSGVKYIISDPVDVYQSMVNALLRRCEMELAIARGRDMGVAQQAYRDALIQAREADKMQLDVNVAGGDYVRTGVNWAYPTAAI
jgi:hypothetical protein